MKNALVLDDSRAHRMVLRNFLTQLGYTIIEAEDGALGWQALKRSQDWSVLLVDWEMPVMNGLEFIRKVRADPSTSHIPIIMVTSIDSPDRMLEAVTAGANEYLIKPLTKDELSMKLNLLGFEGAKP